MLNNNIPSKTEYIITDLYIRNYYNKTALNGNLSVIKNPDDKTEDYITDIRIMDDCTDNNRVKETTGCLELRVNGRPISDIQLHCTDDNPANLKYRFSCIFSIHVNENSIYVTLEFFYKEIPISKYGIHENASPLTENEINSINNYRVFVDHDKRLNIEKFAPRPSYLISCIIPVYNGEQYIREAIGSVLNQTIDFFENIQLILVNDGSTDNSDNICVEYRNKYPDNVTYIHSGAKGENKGVSAARNAGMDYAVGEFISFLDVDDLLTPDYFATAVHYLALDEKQIRGGADAVNIVAFPINIFDSKSNSYDSTLNFRFTETRIVDVRDEPDYIQYGVHSAIFRRSALHGIKFSESLNYSEDAEFIHRILLRNNRYYAINGPAYNYRQRDNTGFLYSAIDDGDFMSATQKRLSVPTWYEQLALFGKLLIEASLKQCGSVTEYTQSLIIHGLLGGAVMNLPESIRQTVDIAGVLSTIAESLQEVSDAIIMSNRHINKWMKYYLLKLKYGAEAVKIYNGKPAFFIGDCFFEYLKPQITIRNIRENDGELRIIGTYALPLYDHFKLVCEFHSKKIISPAELIYYNERDFFLGESVHKSAVFTFVLATPDAEILNNNITFFLYYNDAGYPVELLFADCAACLDNNAESFYTTKTRLILKTNVKNELTIKSLNASAITKAFNGLFKNYRGIIDEHTKSIIKQYNIVYPLLNEKIWIFYDLPDSAGGNAEALFRYCSAIDDGIYKIFVIAKDAYDSYRLKEEYENIVRNQSCAAHVQIVDYGSEQHKFYYLYADKLIVSDIRDMWYLPFKNLEELALLSGIFRRDVVYLPNNNKNENEFTPIWDETLGDMILWTTATEAEQRSILNNYGNRLLLDSSVVRTIGYPRYDMLSDESQNKIIVMPDYNRSLYKGENEYLPDFKYSDYCKSIHDILNDERLLDGLYDLGYELCFAPHAKTYIQFADFDVDASVEVISPSYPRGTLCSECSLLITDRLTPDDYIYMKKPILYYHFADDIEVTQDACNAFLNSFGETATDKDKLIDLILAFAGAGCKMLPNYRDQVDKYFKYTDQKNSERIYEFIKKQA